MKKYNIGIIGYGGFGKFLRHWWDKSDNVQVTAISDTNPKDKMSEGMMHYGNWEDLLDDESIDIVSIATPPGLHVEIACAAMRKGKHVLLEKPIALTLEGAREILRVQKETGRVATIDHMLRYNPIITSLMSLCRQETFGKLRHAEVANYAQDEGLSTEHWFWDKEISGGIFVEHGVHFFDIINALANQEVRKVYSVTHNRNPQQEDQVAATVLYDEGLIASHYHSFSGPGFFEQTTIRLTFDLARIEVEGWIPMSGRVKAMVNNGSLDAMAVLPGLEISEKIPIGDSSDISRPEGWGITQAGSLPAIKSAGIAYDVDQTITATFMTGGTKSEVYGYCVQQIIHDIIAKIEDRSHQLNVSIEDAIGALEIALLAAKQ